jgi:hypothetical protein
LGKKGWEEGLECDVSPLLIVIAIFLSWLEGKSQQPTPASHLPVISNE